jgi:hypothetical protein
VRLSSAALTSVRRHKISIGNLQYQVQRIEEEDENDDWLIAAYGAMQGKKRAGPLHIIIHLDPEFFVIRMEITRYEPIANFAEDTGRRESFAHFINEPPVR